MIRTREDLYDKLSEDLAWRRIELGNLKSLANQRGFGDRKRKALIRSGIVILYAHWEGYVKTAASAYLEYLKRRKLKYEDLSVNFVALGAKKEVGEWVVSDKATSWNQATNFFLRNMSQRCSLPDAIDTKSNLSSKVLREVVASLGLSYSSFRTSEKLIDQRLVSRRNSIAHGDYLDLDEDSFTNVMDRVLTLMKTFMNEIDNSVVQKSYRRS